MTGVIASIEWSVSSQVIINFLLLVCLVYWNGKSRRAGSTCETPAMTVMMHVFSEYQIRTEKHKKQFHDDRGEWQEKANKYELRLLNSETRNAMLTDALIELQAARKSQGVHAAEA